MEVCQGLSLLQKQLRVDGYEKLKKLKGTGFPFSDTSCVNIKLYLCVCVSVCVRFVSVGMTDVCE